MEETFGRDERIIYSWITKGPNTVRSEGILTTKGKVLDIWAIAGILSNRYMRERDFLAKREMEMKEGRQRIVRNYCVNQDERLNSTLYPFNQQLFIEHLLCDRHYYIVVTQTKFFTLMEITF